MLKPYHIPGRKSGDEVIHKEVMSGIYEKYYQLQLDDVVIDCGAHIGFFTTLAAEKVGPTGRIYAFEPEPDNFKWLSKHIEPYPNVTAFHMGAWNCPTTKTLHVATMTGMNTFIDSYKPVNTMPVSIQCETLDNMLGGLTRLDFIKMDTEGCEAQILEGAVNLIARFKPHIVMELHKNKAEVTDWLIKHGYAYVIGRNVGAYEFTCEHVWAGHAASALSG